MRLKYTVAVLLIAVVATPTMPVTGQEEPLPAIQAKSSFEPLTPSIALAVEPIRDLTQRVSLADAARANDYAAFDALYRTEPSPGFATLHELWTFSMTDPVGAFYGQEMYARLTRAYPGFARYIEEYRIVDSNGNVFYPTSETRAFLLDRALEGRTAPRVQVAERSTPSVQPEKRAERASGTPASPPAERAASRRPASKEVAPKEAAAPVKAASVKAAPVAQPAPVQAAARDTSASLSAGSAASAGEDASAPQSASAPQASAPVVTPAAPVAQAPAVTVENNFGTRGIFLLLIGIFGIGILALMLRTPRELPASIMAPPAEPIKRPSAVPPPAPTPQTPQTPKTEKNRASGSHG